MRAALPRPLRPLLLASLILAVAGCDGLDPGEGAAPQARGAPTPTPTPAAPPTPTADEDGAMAYVDDPAEAKVDPAAAARAKVIWDTRCAGCHGQRGDGEGPAAAGMSPPPRDFHRRAWQQATADAHIKRVILGGGAAAGMSPAMAGAPELAERPETLDELVAILRGLPHWQPTPAGVQAP